jgi:pimeloyl-ACP methyl ester carboxylesterase
MNVQFRRVPVHFTVEGDGPVVVLLHGFLEDSSIYDEMAKILAISYRVVCIDLPGHGLSGVVGYRHSMEDMASAVRQVLDTLGVDSCTLVGHSMGGYVALAFAELFPMKTDGLVLFHSTALADSETKLKDRERAIAVVRKNAEAFVRSSIPMLFAEDSRDATGRRDRCIGGTCCQIFCTGYRDQHTRYDGSARPYSFAARCQSSYADHSRGTRSRYPH